MLSLKLFTKAILEQFMQWTGTWIEEWIVQKTDF